MTQSLISSIFSTTPNDNISLDGYTAILANGVFPSSPIALQFFLKTPRLVCCDGSVRHACEHGRAPDYIVGDCDSISYEDKLRFQNKVVQISEQETNDLNKAFRYCLSKNWRDIVILGATGKREDHTLGNISYLVDFASDAEEVVMATDNGLFCVLKEPGTIETKPGVQVSIFSFDPNQEITSEGLKFPLNNLRLPRWRSATLNETLGDRFSLQFVPSSPLLLFFAFQG